MLFLFSTIYRVYSSPSILSLMAYLINPAFVKFLDSQYRSKGSASADPYMNYPVNISLRCFPR